MKITICDVCHDTSKEIVQAQWRTGFSSFRLDVCEAHSKWVKQFKSLNELVEGYRKLLGR